MQAFIHHRAPLFIKYGDYIVKGDLKMNSFDSMIERYKKELIDAKRRSIEKELTDAAKETSGEAVTPEDKDENEKNIFLVFSAEEKESDVPVFSADDESNFSVLSADKKENTEEVFAPNEEADKAGAATPVNAAFEEAFGEKRGFSSSAEAISKNAAQTAENGGETSTAEEPTAKANETEKAQRSFQSESDNLQNEGAVFEENEPFPESLGALKVQVFMANRAYPVSSAHVVITGKENRKVYFDGYTNTNGVVGSILLPAPKKSFSQSPQEKPPYAQYDIAVSHPKFQSRKYLGVPVFSGVESIQNIQLLPLGTDEEDNTDVTESEPNELLMKGGENNA